MSRPATITAEALLDLREPGFRHELVRGELRRMSPAGYWHGAIVGTVAEIVGAHVREHRLGIAFGAETGFLLARDPDTVRAPDLAFVRSDRLPAAPSRGYFPGPPDLAVEVASPGDTFTEVHEKALCWLEHGAQRVWVVDPVARRVTLYRSHRDVRTLGQDEVLEGEHVLPGFAVPVRELFPF